MYGLNGKTEEIILKSKTDTFERKAVRTENILSIYFILIFQVDKFKIEAPDIGQIQKIRIGHHSEKMNAAWYLEKV